MTSSATNSRRIWYKDVLPFTSMVLVECIIAGGNTLFFKSSSSSQNIINSYVFTAYVFLVGFIFLIPCLAFLLLRRRPDIPPLKSPIIVKLFLLSFIAYVSQLFGYVGVKYSSPTLSSVMNNLAPAFTFILAIFFRLEKLNLRSYTSQAEIVGTVVSILGALVATLYNGTPVTVSSDSSSLYWIIGGMLLASQNFLLSFVLVSQLELMVVFVFGLSGLVVAAFTGLIMVRDLDAWKLKPDLMLASIVYMGISTGFLNGLIQVWALHLKGPVYVAMFKPLSIVVAPVMGVIFLGDSLHLGRQFCWGDDYIIRILCCVMGKSQRRLQYSSQGRIIIIIIHPNHPNHPSAAIPFSGRKAITSLGSTFESEETFRSGSAQRVNLYICTCIGTLTGYIVLL